MRVLLAIFSMIAMAAIVYVITLFQPNPHVDIVAEKSSEELQAMTEESYDLQYRFLDALKYRKPTDDDLKILQRAYDLQKQYLEARYYDDGEGAKRLRELRSLYSNYSAERLNEQGAIYEGEALVLFNDLKYSEAIPLFKKATELQRTINEKFYDSKYASEGRVIRLVQMTRECSARSLGDESKTWEEKAEQALLNGNKEEAVKAYKQAIDLQEKINNDMELKNTSRRSYYRLDTLITSYRSLTTESSIEEGTSNAKNLLDESIAFEDKFKAAVASGKMDEQALKYLKDAVDTQEKYVAAINYRDLKAMQRLRDLRQSYQGYVAEPLYHQSLEQEERALIAMDRRNYADASAYIQEAINLQDKINNNYSLSQRNDRSRSLKLNRLQSRIRQMEDIDAIESFEMNAALAMEKEDWAAASAAYKKAYLLQESINNQRMLSTGNENVERSRFLQRGMVTADSAGLHFSIIAMLKEGQGLQEKKQFSEAAQCFEKALKMQRDLNAGYPLSDFASSDKMSEINALFETASGYEAGLVLLKNLDKVETLLKQRKGTDATVLLAELNNGFSVFVEKYPDSIQINEPTKAKIRYLYLVRNNLSALQESVLSNLILLEGNRKMLRTEVTQQLYSDVTGSNPSRNQKDKSQPVENVSYSDAIAFCEKLSWILSQEVRLPTEKEFVLAAGDISDYNPQDVWCLLNAENTVKNVAQKPVNKKGFFDILGNVSEWVYNPDTTVGNIGGNVVEPFSEDMLSFKKQSNNYSSSYLGFRFVVIFSE